MTINKVILPIKRNGGCLSETDMAIQNLNLKEMSCILA